ncbi:unnamed protein product [Dracunculus medinensis]|uniref:NADH dehydrogenase [ubiquinone] 1 alpha subcomplex subunit 12 n=1 Tax=Dracunculus medinensis TaxID=318479 RepID=A0A0N4UEQ2_DRAME|nr:unnamed protein product [Dracunculus medinensis]
MSIGELFGLDKIFRFMKIIKELGGIRATLKKRYLMDETRSGTFVGEDKFGNRYYEDKSYNVPRSRWVEYPEYRWLEYDASQIPPEWHHWLHHMTDKTPVQNPPVQRKWILGHEENLTLELDKKYVPYSTTRSKIVGWQPKNE